MPRVRAGVIGTGSWAVAGHLPALASLPEVELVAIAGIELEQVRATAAEYRVGQTFPSGAEMIAAADLDLVHIVTPDDAHVPDALLAIDRGLAVLGEKPLAVSVADAEMLASRARERGVRTKMGFTLRYSPAVMRLREIVAHGELGRLRTLQAFQQNGQFLDPAKPFHWKMDGARTGGGAIVEYGIHTLDLARWIMGEATRVVATSRTQVAERPDGDGSRRAVTVDDSTAWLMEFEGGATGMLHAGWSTIGRGPGIELRVFGDRGAARAVLSDDLPGGEGLWLATADDQRFLPVEIPDRFSQGLPLEWPWWRRFNHALIRDFVREIQGEATPSATFDDGLAAQRLLEAVIRSTAEDRWVEIA